MCCCERNLKYTFNIYKPGEVDLPVYICENCKRYYVLINFKEIEVEYNKETNTWELT